MNIENEIWKDIEGYEGLYQVSNNGQVKSLEIDCSGIGKCCKCQYKTCGGFIWKYKENNTNLVIS